MTFGNDKYRTQSSVVTSKLSRKIIKAYVVCVGCKNVLNT